MPKCKRAKTEWSVPQWSRMVELPVASLKDVTEGGEISGNVSSYKMLPRTVVSGEDLLWGGASSLCDDIVRMALERVDWPPEDPRWFGMLFCPLYGVENGNAQQNVECCECFRLILARCGRAWAERMGPPEIVELLDSASAARSA